LRLPSRLRCRAHAARFDWRHVAPQIGDVFNEAVRLAGGGLTAVAVAETELEQKLGFST
jgi:hypothetical protein